ncbi:MAG: 50S ribosomal protein L25 [Proteobacteria bacterium]|nr:50S ribosomal protein L25 [Pseudomonadota bacterium]
MEEILIEANVRNGHGKSLAKKIRKEGGIPAVLYGRDIESLPITISLKDWEKLRKQLKRNTILTMKLPDSTGTADRPVMVKNVQRTVISNTICHIDFLQVSMKRIIEVEIPIYLTGTPIGLKDGGIVEQHLRTVMAECLPSQIPEKFEVDITNLGIGDSVHVHEISMPGVKLLENQDVAIVTVIHAAGEEKALTEETVVAEEKKEG